MNILDWLDSLALMWLNSRVDRAAERQMQDSAWKLHKLGADGNGAEVEMVNKSLDVFLLADQMARYLEANNAKNYVQVDMLPRLTRNISPIRMTVQWARGKSPAEVNAALRALLKRARFERELPDELMDEIDAALNVAVE